MLLRRLTQHVKNQNWFAVWLDFAIVVVGVFVGLQVSNWNDAARVQSLEESYLVRLAEELTSNIESFEAETKFADESRATLEKFLEALRNPSTSDTVLVHRTTDYISIGTFFASFRPSQATFDDLKSTGNLDIIRDQELREALVKLHALYGTSRESFDVNLSWLLPVDSDVYSSFDALRFDARTAPHFPQQTTEATAQYIREHKEMLTRHAALHLWLKVRAVELLNDSRDRSGTVLSQIEKLR